VEIWNFKLFRARRSSGGLGAFFWRHSRASTAVAVQTPFSSRTAGGRCAQAARQKKLQWRSPAEDYLPAGSAAQQFFDQKSTVTTDMLSTAFGLKKSQIATTFFLSNQVWPRSPMYSRCFTRTSSIC